MSLEAHPHTRALGPLWLLIVTQTFICPCSSLADVWCHLSEKKSQGSKSLSQRLISHKSVLLFCPYWVCFPPASVSSQAMKAEAGLLIFSHQNRDLPLAYLSPPVYCVTAYLVMSNVHLRLEETKL